MPNLIDDSGMRVVLSADDEWIRPNGRLAEIMMERAGRIGAAGIDVDRLDAIAGALDELREAVSESYFVSRSHGIAAV